MSTVELDRMPATGALYGRAVVGALPGRGARERAATLPDTELVLRGVPVDRSHLADYNRVCGFRLRDTLPATYPHILAFPLSLSLMTAPDFPFALIGLVHLANRITVVRPIDAAEALDLAVHATDLRPHRRGRQVDVVSTATVCGEVVWRGVSTYLSKEQSPTDGERREERERPAPPPATAVWRVGRAVGGDYARVSGDHNPIHTSRLGARLFGFARPIAHGMWSKARCLAALENRLPDAYAVDVSFKLPVPLPSTIAFNANKTGGNADAVAGGTDDLSWGFSLHNARSGKPHLAGSVLSVIEDRATSAK